MYKLKLYIVGETRNTKRLLDDLKLILEKGLKELYSLEVIDVLDHPQRAIDDKIFATPTLVKVDPPPVKKIIGNLGDKEIVLEKLGLYSVKTA